LTDGRTILCQTAEDRNLLREADAIAVDSSVAQHLSIGRLMLIKDACQFYLLGRHQRLVKLAIKRLNASGDR